MSVSSSPIFSVKETAKDVTSSVVGAACCCFTGQPFDTIKVRMQSRAAEFRNIGQAFQRTVTREGVLALWKGWPATLTGMVMENAAAFGMNEQLKRLFPDDETPGAPTNYLKGVVLGGVTGVFCGIALCPADNVKCRVQYIANAVKSGEATPSAYDVALRIWREQGARGFFHGLDAQAMRDGPFYMLFFGGYEVSVLTLKKLIPALPDEANFFISGGLAGMLGWGAVMPFDGPKSIIQASWNRSAFGHFAPVMAKVYAERGLSGLYAGFGPAMIRAFPANAALFLGYEMARSVLAPL
jgi:solute carrier family 25 carnitine/acylcarnitine transporter 20/29